MPDTRINGREGDPYENINPRAVAVLMIK